MIKKKRRKTSRNQKRRMRIIKAYFNRVLLLLFVLGCVYLLIRGVGHIFRPAGGDPGLSSEETQEEGEGFFAHDIFSHAGEARHHAGKEEPSDEAGAEDTGEDKPFIDDITVDSAGRIRSTAVADFDENMYSADELRQSVTSSIEEYDRLSKGTVTLGDLKVSKGSARCVINYESAADYRGFNGVGLYVGGVDELLLAGVSYDRELLPVNDKREALPAGSTGEITRQKLITLAVDAGMKVKVPGAIVYASDDVTVTGKKTAECHVRDGYSFVIYKKPFLNLF